MRNFNIMSDEELNRLYNDIITDNTPLSEKQQELQDEELNNIVAEQDKRNIIR